MYLTDDLNNPTKWQIPDTAIAPSGFLLFWADEDQEQGPLHTNFKLSRSGEQIGLFDTEAMGNPVIDTLSYSSQTTDVSYGRLPDGGAEWRTFDTPTPGKSNRESPVRIADNGTEQKIPTRFALSQNFPNPFNPETNIGYDLPKAGCVRLHIYDIRGRRVKTLSDGNQAAGSYNVSWDGTAENNKPVASGVYVYRLIAGDAVKLRKMLLLR